jgi:uncharacterized membrane protein YedE/YeeE
MLLNLSSLIAGVIFGAGLAVSQMMNPAKVIGFLDFAGNWDPTLGLVMVGALIVSVPCFALVAKRATPALDDSFAIPHRRDIDWPLLGGAAIFGIGWGLAGFCPGPALAALQSGNWQVFGFVGAMIAGILLFHATASKWVHKK